MKRLLLKLMLLTFALCFTAGCKSEADSASPMAVAANETAAIARLRSIITAEQNYKAETGKYGSLDELIKAQMIGDPSQGKLGGYKYEITTNSKVFQATAVPEEYGVTGKRSFYADQTGALRGKDKKGEKAGPGDPAI